MAMTGKEFGRQPAIPSSRVEEQVSAKVAYHEGVTKRELFAALALQGILANQHYDPPRREKLDRMAEDAVRAADDLCEALAKDGAP